MKTIGKLVLSGLATVLPVALTLYVIWWLGSGAEAVLGGALRRVLPEPYYVPGAGLVVGFGLLLAVGFVMRFVLARRLAHLVNRLVDRIPLVKTVYGAVSDLLTLFSAKREEDIDQVVLVTLTEAGVRALGLVTRPEVPLVDAGTAEDPISAVYLPMSYGIGGYTVLVARSRLEPVEMTVEEALRFTITAGAPSKEAATRGHPAVARQAGRTRPDETDR